MYVLCAAKNIRHLWPRRGAMAARWSRGEDSSFRFIFKYAAFSQEKIRKLAPLQLQQDIESDFALILCWKSGQFLNARLSVLSPRMDPCATPAHSHTGVEWRLFAFRQSRASNKINDSLHTFLYLLFSLGAGGVNRSIRYFVLLDILGDNNAVMS